MKGEFKSFKSYRNFAHSVRKWRYIRSPEDEAFLESVAHTTESRVQEVEQGATLWRAQVAHEVKEMPHDRVEVPAGPERMKPPAYWSTVGRSNEGRINPKGIPVLYLSTAEDPESAVRIAISEVRPDVGSFVTVATLRTKRALNIVNATTDDERVPIVVHVAEPAAPGRELAVWRDIDRALSEPVARSDDRADYAPTQIIAELFRKQGLDGIAYRSSFSPGHNIALFDLDAADVLTRTLYEVTAIDLRYSLRYP